MTWISLGLLLLLFNGQISTTTEFSIRVTEFKKTAGQFRTWHQNAPKTAKLLSDNGCEQAAKQMKGDLNSRSLAPWKYRIDRDDSRLPHEIAVAECLCRGCIINQRQNHDYNSVPVYAPLMVLTKTRGSDKYSLRRDVLWIPVACTCVLPK